MWNADALAGSFRFTLNIEGVSSLNAFSEVTGLQATVTTETIKEGGVNDYTIQLPTSITYPNLVLKRGIVSPELFDWVMELRDSKDKKITRRNITISLLDRDGNEESVIQEWHFAHAMPVKWNGPSLNATSSAIAMESMEFIHSGITKGNFATA